MDDARTILNADILDVATGRIEIPDQNRRPYGGIQADALKPHIDEWLGPKIQIGPLDV